MDMRSRMHWQLPTVPLPMAGPVEPSGFIRNAATPTPTPLSVAPAGQGLTHCAGRLCPAAKLIAAASRKLVGVLLLNRYMFLIALLKINIQLPNTSLVKSRNLPVTKDNSTNQIL